MRFIITIALAAVVAASPSSAIAAPRSITEANCAARAGHLLKIVEDYAATRGRVVYDPTGFWQCTGATLNRLARHITLEEFRNPDPVRTGAEPAMYEKIKAYVASRPPTERLGMDKLLRMGLEASASADGTVNLQVALLTVHNVVRILARPKVWPPEPNPADPAYPVYMDLMAMGRMGEQSFPAQVGERLQPLDRAWSLRRLFDAKDGPFQIQPGLDQAPTPADATMWNGGCHYYYWIGAMARTTMGAAAILGGLFGEALGKKPDVDSYTPVDAALKTVLVNPTDQGVIELAQFVCGSNFGTLAENRRKSMLAPVPGEPSSCPAAPSSAQRVVLQGRSFETVVTDKGMQPGRMGRTPTSQWGIGDGWFKFASKKDDFKYAATWDAPPLFMEAMKPYLFTFKVVLNGPRKWQMVFTPSMDVTGWRISKHDASKHVDHPGPNAWRMTLDGNAVKSHQVAGHMQLHVTPVGRGANIDSGEVVGGSGKFYRGKKPGEFDAWFLEVNVAGISKARYTYVPEGAPSMRDKKVTVPLRGRQPRPSLDGKPAASPTPTSPAAAPSAAPRRSVAPPPSPARPAPRPSTTTRRTEVPRTYTPPPPPKFAPIVVDTPRKTDTKKKDEEKKDEEKTDEEKKGARKTRFEPID